MGPRVRTRGDRCFGFGVKFDIAASMGPRVRTRGDSDVAIILRQIASLQWGRAFARAEIRTSLSAFVPGTQLQWGRAFARAEIWRSASAVTPSSALQWGRAFARAEIITSCWILMT